MLQHHCFKIGLRQKMVRPFFLFAAFALPMVAQVNSDNPKDVFRVANQQFARRRFADAKASFAHAIQLDRLYSDAYRGLGMTELELKDYQAAYHAWLKAVDLNPGDEKSKYYLGRLFYEANLPNEAATWLRQALTQTPSDFQAMTYLGLCAEALNLDDTAGMLYRKAVAESQKQNTPYSWAFLSLGNYLKKQGEGAQALRVLEQGAQKCPEAHELTALGELLSAPDPQRAEQVLRQAIALDPSFSQPHYRLGLLLKSLGRNEEAHAEMTQFQAAKAEEDKNSHVMALRK